MFINYITWDIDPEIFNFFGISLRYYGVLFITGIVLCILILQKIYTKEGIPIDRLDKLTRYGVIGILVGARLGHCLLYEPGYYLSHPIEMLLPIQEAEGGGYVFTGYQGLASHGGALGLFIALLFYSKKTKESILKTLDFISIVAPLSACFIRIANLMNSEIIGVTTDVPWAFIFVQVDQEPRHPAQLYEAIIYLLIFGVLFSLYYTKREVLKNGFFFGLAITLIFTARFFVEFVKVNQVGFEDEMSYNMGQLLSLPYLLAGIGFMVYGYVKTKKMNALLLGK